VHIVASAGAAGCEDWYSAVSLQRTGKTEGRKLETGKTVQPCQSSTGPGRPRVK